MVVDLEWDELKNNEAQKLVIFQFMITNTNKCGIFEVAKRSAYPSEQEVILAGGLPCYVLHIDEGRVLNHKQATIIYLAL